MVLPLQRALTLQLVAAATTGICTSQSGTAATPLTINGSLASGGVATMDVARRVIVTSAGNDSGITFTIVGTNVFGRTMTEVLTGANTAAAATVRDFLTVTSITPSGNTASTVTAGTNTTASTVPMIVDTVTNPSTVALAAVLKSGSATFTVEQSFDDLAPAFDVYTTPPTWIATTISAVTSTTTANLTAAPNMIRLTNTAGTGLVSLSVLQNLRAGGF